MTKYALVGDVGGTNARLALCDIASGEISQAKTYSGLDYPSLEAVVRVYLDEHSVSVEDGCIAIACPNEKIEEMIQLSGLSRLLPSFVSLDAAIAYAEGRKSDAV